MPPYFLILATKKDAKSGVITAIFGFIAAACPAVNLNLSCSFVIAAEQKARTTYDNILRLVDDPDVRDPIKYLRQREINHFQRFGEALEIAKSRMDSKNFYAVNPEYDR